MLRLSKPLPVPTWPPAALVVPSMYPWKMFCTSASAGATPGVKRDSMIGMFENIGSPSTICRSKFWPEETVVASSSGASATTVTSSAELTDLQRQGQIHGLADGQRDAGLRQGLVALQLDANLVGARIEQDGLEVAAAVRHELLRLTRGRIRDSHGGAGNDPAAVLDDAVDIAASLLSGRCQKGPKKRDNDTAPRRSHVSPLSFTVRVCRLPVLNHSEKAVQPRARSSSGPANPVTRRRAVPGWRTSAWRTCSQSAVALRGFLAVVGIYSMMAYSVSQRRHEFGVRMALGASAQDVIRLSFVQAARLTAVGLAVGILLSGVLSHLMSSALFGVIQLDVTCAPKFRDYPFDGRGARDVAPASSLVCTWGTAVYFCSANVSATSSARAAVLAHAMFDARATTIPLSRRLISHITLPPASSLLTLSAFVARAKRTRSDGVESNAIFPAQ